jgi:hypothetical protein
MTHTRDEVTADALVRQYIAALLANKQDEAANATKAMVDYVYTNPPAAQPAPVALPCCGYTDAGAVKWNPFNGVVQCHNCGQTYTQPAVQEPVAEVIALTKLENESTELTPRIIALTLDLSIGEKLYRREK